MRKLILLFLVIPLLAACSLYRINSEDVATFLYPEKPASEVVYLEDVKKPHEVIGFVTVAAERSKSNDTIIRKMKKGTSEPLYEKYILKLLGINKLE